MSDRAPLHRRPALELATILTGALIALAPLHVTYAKRNDRFEEFALDRETKVLFARVDGAPIHCEGVTDAHECLAGHARRGGRPVALWLGNSQLHAVNQLQAHEENAPPILFRYLATQGIDLITFSQPNANLQEHLTLFAYLVARLPVRHLLLPIVFDDLREVGIRSEIASAFEDPQTVATLERFDVGRQILARHVRSTDSDLAALHQTVQESTEAALTNWLTQHSRLWALRPQARGAVFAKLYLLRNSLLGITAQSKRKMIPGRMELNLSAARALLQSARDSDIDALVYVVPLRSDVETPYIEREYSAFKLEIEAMAHASGASFANLEALIPVELWGHKDSTNLESGVELDFMHFQSGGHRLLADELARLLAPQVGSRPL